MVEPVHDSPPVAPIDSSRVSWRSRLLSFLGRARKPLIAVAAVGTVLSGLVGYWTTWRVVQSTTANPPAAAIRTGSQVTIAVLPFANLSDDRSDEYFADGVTDELIQLLTRVRGLHVAPRSSSFSFKGSAVPANEAARRIGAVYLVEGSVRRASGRVRIGAQLVSAADGRVIWARSFDRDFKDVLAAQTEIAIGIAGSLMPSLDPDLGLSGSGTKSPQAWQAYLEARRLPLGERESAYSRVLALDSKFARVYTALAEDVLASPASRERRPKAAYDQVVKYLQQALRIDPRDDHAWGLLGAAAQLIDDSEALRDVARRALEANRDSAAGSAWQSEVHLLDGDIGAALPLFQRTAEQLPLVDFARNLYVQALRLANRPTAALEAAEQSLALDPESQWAQVEKVKSLLALGRQSEALSLARNRSMYTILIRFGTPEDLAALRNRKDLDAHAMAWLQFLEGHPNKLVEHLESEHSHIQARSRVLFDPEYDPVRELPAYKSWLDKHGLTESQGRALAWRAANPVQRN